MFVITSLCVFFFKQKTAYDMRISDWSSDVCSSDLASSIVTTVSFLIEMPDTTQLPPRGIDVANAYALAPPGIKASVAACPDADAGGCTVEEDRKSVV